MAEFVPAHTLKRRRLTALGAIEGRALQSGDPIITPTSRGSRIHELKRHILSTFVFWGDFSWGVSQGKTRKGRYYSLLRSIPAISCAVMIAFFCHPAILRSRLSGKSAEIKLGAKKNAPNDRCFTRFLTQPSTIYRL